MHNVARPWRWAWADQADRFVDYSVRHRGADALLWLMVKTSGICQQATLTPRAGRAKKHDVRILLLHGGDFCSQGLEARGKW